MTYRLIEHTADIGMEVEGKDLRALFENGALAFFDILLESGKVEEARRVIVEAIRLSPDDAWAYLLLANLYASDANRRPLAERYYAKTLSLKSDDIYALTSYAGVSVQMGKAAQGRELFERAIGQGIVYPNAYYGMALLEFHEGNRDAAQATLDRLFEADRHGDIRSGPVYAEARCDYTLTTGRYTATVRVVRGQDVVLVQDEFDTSRDTREKAYFQFSFKEGLDASRVAARGRFWGKLPDEKAYEGQRDYALTFDADRRELSVIGYVTWWPRTTRVITLHGSKTITSLQFVGE